MASVVSDVLDMHTRRVAAGRDYIPDVAKFMLLAVAIVALFFIGNISGFGGRSITWRTWGFALMLAALFMMTLNMERAHDGFVRLDSGIMSLAADVMRMALNQ